MPSSLSVDDQLVTDRLTSLYEELEAIEAELCRRFLHKFIRKTWSILEPEKKFIDNWHIHVMCRELEAITAGKQSRLIFNVPPGTMKTLLILVFWPLWEWLRKPGLRYLMASYTSERTMDANVKVRQIIVSEWFQKYFGEDVKLSGDQNAKERLATTEGGFRIATSVNGLGTGEHPDRILIDDPVTATQARSDKERTAANAWFDRTLTTRGVSRGVSVVIDMQRLDMDDLTGHVLARGPQTWNLVCFPMRYEVSRENEPDWRPDPRDPRTEPGELMWPELFTEARVRQMELDLGPYGTAGQLQQRPAPEGGGLFKRTYFKFVDVAPRQARRVRCWDTAATEGGGDYTAGVKVAINDETGLIYIEDVRRGQWGPAEVDAQMMTTAEADGVSVSVRELREPGSAGKTVIDARSRNKVMRRFDYGERRVSNDKPTEAKPLRGQAEAGNVLLVRGDWNEEFLREAETFPVGLHDDQIDGASGAYNVLVNQELPKPVSIAWAR